MNSTMKVTFTIIITGLVVGLGTYYIVGQKATNDKAKLQNTIDNLNMQLGTTSNDNTSTGTQLATCASADLKASLNSGEGTAGKTYYTLAIQNNGASDCSYTDITRVALLDKSGTEVGSTSVTSSGLTIATGGSVYSAIGFPDPTLYSNTNGSACKKGVTTLNVTLDGQTAPIVVTGLDTLQAGFTDYFCPDFSVGAFSTTKP